MDGSPASPTSPTFNKEFPSEIHQQVDISWLCFAKISHVDRGSNIHGTFSLGFPASNQFQSGWPSGTNMNKSAEFKEACVVVRTVRTAWFSPCSFLVVQLLLSKRILGELIWTTFVGREQVIPRHPSFNPQTGKKLRQEWFTRNPKPIYVMSCGY